MVISPSVTWTVQAWGDPFDIASFAAAWTGLSSPSLLEITISADSGAADMLMYGKVLFSEYPSLMNSTAGYLALLHQSPMCDLSL